MKYLGKKTDNLDIATQNDLGGGGGTSAEEIANRKRVDRYNIPTYTSGDITVQEDIIPKEWTAITNYRVYTNGDITITCNNGSSNYDTKYICDGSDITRGRPSSTDPFIIDFGKQYKITKFKTHILGAFTVQGSNDNENWTSIYTGSQQNLLTSITITNPNYYRYYQFVVTTNVYFYEVQVEEYIGQIVNAFLIEDGGSTNYEEQERLLIQTPNVVSIQTNPTISKNNLTAKTINGTLEPNKKYELVYENGQYEIITPQASGPSIFVSTGTVAHNGTIPQTAGYNNYMYFVSMNSCTASANGVSSGTGGNIYSKIAVDCSVNQTTRKVTARLGTYINNGASGTITYTNGTANYMEIAWN